MFSTSDLTLMLVVGSLLVGTVAYVTAVRSGGNSRKRH